MAALTQDSADLAYQGELSHALREGRVIASEILYANSFVAFAAAGGIQAVSGDLALAGVCYAQVDNSGGALGDLKVSYMAWGAIRITGLSGYADTDEGVLVYCDTDNPLDTTKTAAGATLIGTILEVVSASEIVVELAGPGS